MQQFWKREDLMRIIDLFSSCSQMLIDRNSEILQIGINTTFVSYEKNHLDCSQQ